MHLGPLDAVSKIETTGPLVPIPGVSGRELQRASVALDIRRGLKVVLGFFMLRECIYGSEEAIAMETCDIFAVSGIFMSVETIFRVEFAITMLTLEGRMLCLLVRVAAFPRGEFLSAVATLEAMFGILVLPQVLLRVELTVTIATVNQHVHYQVYRLFVGQTVVVRGEPVFAIGAFKFVMLV